MATAQIDSLQVDKHYLEDQIYVGLTYNILTNKPTDFVQNGFSGGFSIGFIKDVPLNTSRNFGFGIGLGYAYNAFIQNLKISEASNGLQVLEIIDNQNFDSNRFLTHAIEMPIELRWRTSTATKYKFWRIYTGVKIGYVVANSSKFNDNLGEVQLKNLQNLQKLQYGLTLSAGFNTFNLHAYYGLNPLFKNTEINNKSLDVKQLNVGLIFYIL